MSHPCFEGGFVVVDYFVADIDIDYNMVVDSSLVVVVDNNNSLVVVVSMVGQIGSLLGSCCYPDISLD